MSQLDRAHTTTRIAPRFNGPPGMGNGGIVCALIAPRGADAFEAELLQPAPLDRDLRIEHDDEGGAALWDGDRLVARSRPGALDLEVPPPPTWPEAEAAHAAVRDAPHPFPGCFVCGPARAEGDGLRVIAGPVPGRGGLFAAPWHPDAAFADPATGRIAERFVWSALDCPGGIAALGGRNVPILLARFRGRIEGLPRPGERCMLMGWPIEHTGRKHVTGTALIGSGGNVLGRAEALWIEPRSDRAAA